jgi:hypothetical protein
MFELSIKSTKDVDEISIKFSDGTFSTTSIEDTEKTQGSIKQSRSTSEKKETPRVQRRDEKFIDLDTEFGSVPQDVVQKPEITPRSGISVAPEMQNLEL